MEDGRLGEFLSRFANGKLPYTHVESKTDRDRLKQVYPNGIRRRISPYWHEVGNMRSGYPIDISFPPNDEGKTLHVSIPWAEGNPMFRRLKASLEDTHMSYLDSSYNNVTGKLENLHISRPGRRFDIDTSEEPNDMIRFFTQDLQNTSIDERKKICTEARNTLQNHLEYKEGIFGSQQDQIITLLLHLSNMIMPGAMQKIYPDWDKDQNKLFYEAGLDHYLALVMLAKFDGPNILMQKLKDITQADTLSAFTPEEKINLQMLALNSVLPQVEFAPIHALMSLRADAAEIYNNDTALSCAFTPDKIVITQENGRDEQTQIIIPLSTLVVPYKISLDNGQELTFDGRTITYTERAQLDTKSPPVVLEHMVIPMSLDTQDIIAIATDPNGDLTQIPGKIPITWT